MSIKHYLSLAVLFLLFSCDPEVGIVEEFCPEEFSADDQIAIGSAISTIIDTDPSLYPTLDKEDYQEAYDYVTKLLQTLVQTPIVDHRNLYNWEVNIIQDDAVKTAFFLPGGRFFIYTGLLKFLETENQLLSVIGHELYYVDTEAIPVALGEAVKCEPLSAIILEKEDIPNLPDFAAAMSHLNFESNSVMDADAFAIDLLCPFLYEPLGIREIIQMAQEQEENLEWLIHRAANNEERVNQALVLGSECGIGGVRNEEDYSNFKELDLP